jgi:hypothetical protein
MASITPRTASSGTDYGKENPMRILFINNSGAGFADYIDVEAGTQAADP